LIARYCSLLPALAGLLCLLPLAGSAAPKIPTPPYSELKLVAEHPVDGMPNGNLSGLARCGSTFWTLSDRDDDRIYRLSNEPGAWQAETVMIDVPEPPPSGLPWKLQVMAKAAGFVRGGFLDWEGMSCDGYGNRYLVSEATANVLMVPAKGSPHWLNLPADLTQKARAHGLLQDFNGIYEGITVDAAGERLWLAAEHHKRGIVHVRREGDAWACAGDCVLLSEGGLERAPPGNWKEAEMARDFTGMSYYDGKLYALERLMYRICRRDPATGQAERCWSFAEAALQPNRRYTEPAGPEALWVDEEGAWVGVDNNESKRADGDSRSIIWHFAPPAGGWSGNP
jgi:hypothetical protein